VRLAQARRPVGFPLRNSRDSSQSCATSTGVASPGLAEKGHLRNTVSPTRVTAARRVVKALKRTRKPLHKTGRAWKTR
jgi:hypothetical protein